MAESKMSKILKSIVDKAKAELEEEKRKEAEMSEKKVDLPIDDIIGKLDLELNDIVGDITRCGTKDRLSELKATEPVRIPATTTNPPISKKPLPVEGTGLDRFCNKTWICYVEDGQLVPVELEDCTAREFGKWLEWIYPPAKAYLKEDLHYYEKLEHRKQAFSNTVAFLSRLPSIFKAYGDTGFTRPKEDKDKAKRKEKKNE